MFAYLKNVSDYKKGGLMRKSLKSCLLVLSASFVLLGCDKGGGDKPVETEIIDPVKTGDGDGGEVTPPEPYEPWEPEIIDLDEPADPDGVPVDDTVYDYSSISYRYPNGGFTESAGVYSAAYDNSLAINETTTPPFTHGTIQADFVYTTASDSGLIFGCSAKSDYFWEGSGVSYYMFFINYQGNTYLAKTDNGQWITIASGRKVGIQSTTEPVTLKCYFYGDKISCFVNDELLIAVKDPTYLKGTGYGFRAGAKNVKVSNVTVSSSKI